MGALDPVFESLGRLTAEAVGQADAPSPGGAGDHRLETLDPGVRKAAAFLAKGKIAETLRQCLEVVKRDPDDALTRLFAAIVLFKRGDLDEAARQFRKFLARERGLADLAAEVRVVLDSLEDHRARREGPGGEAGAAQPRGRVARVTCRGREPGSVLNVNWVITRRCNFSCSYCTAYDNSVAYPSERELKSAVDKIAKLGRADVKVVLTGGEPTIHPGYVGFVKHMAERLPNLSTLRTETNLSRTPRFYRDLVEATKDHAGILAFHGSYHFEFTALDRFLANARFLSEHGIDVQLRLLAHPERMPEVRWLAAELSAHRGPHLALVVKTVRKHFGAYPDDRYTEEDLVWLSEVHDTEELERAIAVDFAPAGEGAARSERRYFSPNGMIASGLNRFRGMCCFAGVEMLSIGLGGGLDGAVCFRGSKAERPNIYRDPAIPLAFLEPVICPFDACGCPEDIAISKLPADLR